MSKNNGTGEHAFADGSKKDKEYFDEVAKHRRSKMTSHEVAKRMLDYLKAQTFVLEQDLKRYRQRRDVDAFHSTRARLHWVEGMIYWINHNV